jgi:phosphoserine phosphatase RsbU/P
MLEGANLTTLDQEIVGFLRRVADLKDTHTFRRQALLHSGRSEGADLLESILLELDLAAEELHTVHDELVQRSDEIAARSAGDAERQLLHSIYQTLPVPVLLLERDGRIRRLNPSAAELLGVSAGYATGRPFPVFLDLSCRATFRSRLAATARGEGSFSPSSLVTRDGQRILVRLCMTSLSGEDVSQTLAVLLPLDAQPAPAAEHARDTAITPEREPAPVVRRLDVMDRMTRLLLDEECRGEPVLLRRTAHMLATEFAPWAIVDMVHGGELERAVVIGTDEGYVSELSRIVDCPVVQDTLRSGEARVQAYLDDLTIFGVGSDGLPVLGRIHARSLTCIPLRLDADILGTVTLIRGPERAPFELAEVALLEDLVDHVALAVRNERHVRRCCQVSKVLQSSLLSPPLIVPPGLEVAAVNYPADRDVGIGGDFYDAYCVADGWGIAVGDACGTDEHAAAAAAMVRNAIRLFGSTCPRPDEVLHQTHRAMTVQEGSGRHVTAVVAHLAWQGESLRAHLASAGHPAAMILRRSGRVRPATGGGMPLGLFGSVEVAVESLELQAGEVLLLYSDGATDNRSPSGEFFGEERLAAALAAHADRPVAYLVESLREEIVRFADGVPGDDLCLLAVRVRGVQNQRPELKSDCH